MNRFDDMLFDLDFRRRSLIRDFMEEERGAVDIIAMLVMIVVVIAVATLFQKQLLGIVEKAFGKLSEFFD